MRTSSASSRCLLPSLLIVLVLVPVAVSRDPSAAPCKVDVLFSLGGRCQTRIVAEITKAQKHVKIQAYSFTNAEIARALLAAKKRGVEVEALLDKSNRTDQYSAATFMANQGIPCFIDDKHAIAHNKIIIIDDETVITGSYNFTKSAEERNAENVLVLGGMPDVAQKYVTNYQMHRQHAVAYTPVGSSMVVQEPTSKGGPTVYTNKGGGFYHKASDCPRLRDTAIAIPLFDVNPKLNACGNCKPMHR